MPENRPLAPDVFLMLGTKVALLAIQILITIVVARELGTTGRGAVAVAFSFTTMLIMFGTFGLQTANPFFAAQDPTRIGRIVANSLWLALVLGGLMIAVGLAIDVLFPSVLRGLDWLEVAVVLVGVPIALASTLLQNILLAEGRMKAYNLIELLIAVAVVAGLWVGLAQFDAGVLFAISWMVGVSAAGALIFLILLMPHRPAVRRPDLQLARRMLSYGFRIYVATLIAYMVGRTNLLLVNSYLGNAEAGLYSVAVALADGLHLIPTVVAVNLFPRIARGLDYQYTAVVFRSVTLLFGLICIASVPLAAPAIEGLFGPAYEGTTEIYYWMLPGIFAYGTLNVLGYHFAARGFPLEAMLIWIPGMAINLGIVFIWMPGERAWVAALATSIAYTVVLALHMRTFAKESGGYDVLIPRPTDITTLLAGALRAIRPRAAG